MSDASDGRPAAVVRPGTSVLPDRRGRAQSAVPDAMVREIAVGRAQAIAEPPVEVHPVTRLPQALVQVPLARGVLAIVAAASEATCRGAAEQSAGPPAVRLTVLPPVAAAQSARRELIRAVLLRVWWEWAPPELLLLPIPARMPLVQACWALPEPPHASVASDASESWDVRGAVAVAPAAYPDSLPPLQARSVRPVQLHSCRELPVHSHPEPGAPEPPDCPVAELVGRAPPMVRRAAVVVGLAVPRSAVVLAAEDAPVSRCFSMVLFRLPVAPECLQAHRPAAVAPRPLIPPLEAVARVEIVPWAVLPALLLSLLRLRSPSSPASPEY